MLLPFHFFGGKEILSTLPSSLRSPFLPIPFSSIIFFEGVVSLAISNLKICRSLKINGQGLPNQLLFIAMLSLGTLLAFKSCFEKTRVFLMKEILLYGLFLVELLVFLRSVCCYFHFKFVYLFIGSDLLIILCEYELLWLYV